MISSANPVIRMVNNQEPALQERLTDHFLHKESVAKLRIVSIDIRVLLCIFYSGNTCAFLHSDKDIQGDDGREDKERIQMSTAMIRNLFFRDTEHIRVENFRTSKKDEEKAEARDKNPI